MDALCPFVWGHHFYKWLAPACRVLAFFKQKTLLPIEWEWWSQCGAFWPNITGKLRDIKLMRDEIQRGWRDRNQVLLLSGWVQRSFLSWWNYLGNSGDRSTVLEIREMPSNCTLKNCSDGQSWHLCLIPALEKQKQAKFWVQVAHTCNPRLGKPRESPQVQCHPSLV